MGKQHLKRIILKRGEERRILGGHPWVYDNEIEQIVLYSQSKEGVDKGFFKRRIREAISRRATYDLRTGIRAAGVCRC